MYIPIKSIFSFIYKKRIIFLAALIFILTFSIYLLTLLPTVGNGDVAKFQFVPYNISIPHTTGYPAYILISRLFSYLPVGSLAYRINLMSAFFASLTGVVLFLINLKITKAMFKNPSHGLLSNFPASSLPCLFSSFLASIIFCFSLTMWSQALIAEVYTLNIFFMAIILLSLINFYETKQNKFIFIAFIFFAIALGNHMLVISILPAIIAAILLTDLRFFKNIKNIIFMLLPFIITLLLYSFIYLRAQTHPVYNEGNIDSFNSFIWYLTGGVFKGKFFNFGINELFDRFLMFCNILLNQFTVPVIVLGTIGFFLMLIKKLKIFIIINLIFIFNILIIINYNIFDIDIYIIPSAFIFSIFFCYAVFFLIETARNMPLKQKENGVNLLTIKLLRITVIFLIIIMPAVSLYNFHSNYKINDQSKQLKHYIRAKNIVSKVDCDAVIIPEDYFTSMSLLYYTWVEHEKNNIIIPFSFIANPYYVDLKYLESELGIKREPFRLNLEDINRYKEENNIFLEDMSEIIKKRPVYILQKNPIIENKFNLKEITMQTYDFNQLLYSIPSGNYIIIFIKDMDQNIKTGLSSALGKIGFDNVKVNKHPGILHPYALSDYEIFDKEYLNLMVITDKKDIIYLAELEENKQTHVNAILKNLNISLKTDIEVTISDEINIKINGGNRSTKNSIVTLNLDKNFNKFDIYDFADFKGFIEIPYSFSNPQIFKILSLKE